MVLRCSVGEGHMVICGEQYSEPVGFINCWSYVDLLRNC